jgi:hypothetical protein
MRYDLMAVIGGLLVLWVIFLGCGLALERILRVHLPNALLLPLGLCVSLVLTFPGYVLGAGDTLAIALLAVVAIAGLAFARGGLLARLNPGWPGAAAAGVYLLYMLPVIAYGRWTWSGYGFVGDSSFEMLLANHAKGFGTTLGNIPETSAREFLASYLAGGYPLGTQTLLGTLSGLTATPVEVLYQPFIGALAAVSAIALATIPRGLLSARRAAVAAALALGANLTYQYALQGGIKEIGLLATVFAAVALAREALVLARPYVGATLVAVAAAAALACYNAVAIPYLGALVVFTGLAVGLAHRPSRGTRRLTRRVLVARAARWVGPLVAGGGVAVLLAIPSLSTFQTFFNNARAGQGSTGVGATQFGQLVRPLPLSQMSGVWLSGEYRLPVMPQPAATLTVIAAVAILVSLVAGLIWTLWRREPGPLLLLGTVGLVMLVAYPRVSPYAKGKLLAIGSPAVAFVALCALLEVRGRAALAALAVAGALALAILASDLLAYSHDRVAPTSRMVAIQQVGRQFRGEGLVLWNEFDEYAKYFGREARLSVPFEAVTPQQVVLRHPTYFYGHYFDLDEEVLSFVEAYPIIVTRRSPAASRPPANYQLAYQNDFYLGWRRVSRPQVLVHLPEQTLYSSTAAVSCGALRSVVRDAPSSAELVAAVPPELVLFEPLYARDRSFAWGLDPQQRGAVVPNGPGHASGVLDVGGGGRYSVWVQGDFPRPTAVSVDGHTVGFASESNTPGQWIRVGSVVLDPGGHTVRVARPGGRRHLGPGEWAVGRIGAVALQRDASESLHAVPLVLWRSLCGKRLDWVELVRP